MSCDKGLSIPDIAAEVAELLAANYIDKDDPRINLGVFTAPTIRGEFVLDEPAKDVFCATVQSCGTDIPYGKQWLDRPIYPNAVLVSYEDSGQTKVEWTGVGSVRQVPEVVGSKTDGTALASLLTALATYGLIIDSTT